LQQKGRRHRNQHVVDHHDRLLHPGRHHAPGDGQLGDRPGRLDHEQHHHERPRWLDDDHADPSGLQHHDHDAPKAIGLAKQ
jgi:hypothetical protein